jgi:ATP phosphoribosyltransferase
MEATLSILERAGYKVSGQDRTYRLMINDPNIDLKALRAQEIPVFVSEGLHDVGITGVDWIRETAANVEILQNLDYGKVRIVVAVPKRWTEIDSLSGLMETLWKEGKNVRISTEYLNITAEYVRSNRSYRKAFGDLYPLVVTPWWRKGDNCRVSIFLSFGATEAKPPEDADVIVDASETGTTLEQNDLKAIEMVMDSEAVFIANKRSLASPQKREKIYDIVTLLKGVVDGTKRLHIFANVRKCNLPKLLEKLPALKSPTIAPLSDKDWYSINTVIEKDVFLELLPVIRRLAQGLVVYEPRQVLTLDEVNRREKL